MSIMPGAPARRRWITNMRWTAALLAVWFMVTFVIAFFARDLSMHLFNLDWTLTYWTGAQSTPITYVLITVLYVWHTNCVADTVAEHEEAVQRDTSEPTQPPSI